MSIDDVWNTRYKPLAQRMREAAETIRETNRIYEFGINCPWSPYALDAEATVVESQHTDD